MKKFDIAVIGGGPGGYVAAIKAAQSGYRTVLFEGHKIGGVCLNYGCIPTKTLLASAQLYHQIVNAKDFGIEIDSADVSLNWPAIMKRKSRVVNRLTGGVATLLKHNGVEVIEGFAEAKSETVLSCKDEDYHFKHLIIATGSHPSMPDIPGLQDSYQNGKAIDSTGAIQLDEIPDSLVVLGGGVIAVEFATLYRSLGSKVTMIQRSPEILSKLDDDVKKAMARALKKLGIKVHTDTSLTKVDGATVYYTHKGTETEISGDYILASLGRAPNLAKLDKLNLETTKRGIVVNQYCQTNQPHIYAIGDVTGRIMLAHVASAEGLLAVNHIAGKGRPLNYDNIPSCIYSFPEVSQTGLTEREARQAGHDIEVGMFTVGANGKALAAGEKIGFVKIITDKKYGQVLGMHIVASHATDMIAEATVAIDLEATIEDIAHSFHPHPTLSEMVMEAAHTALGTPIHTIK